MLRLIVKVMVCCVCITTSWRIEAQNSYTEPSFDKPPQRVVTLSWDLAEDVLELGITPIGMPEISNYMRYVARPAIPSTTQDIGLRIEPNLELISQLKPDVILISDIQLHLYQRLQEIAPVIFYKSYGYSQDNISAIKKTFLKIAYLLDKQTFAEQKITEIEQRFVELNHRLDIAYPNGRPSADVFRFASPTLVNLYTENSIPYYVLNRLGFESAIMSQMNAVGKSAPLTNRWGVSKRRTASLNSIGNGIALYFEPNQYAPDIEKSIIWQSMPFVKNNLVKAVKPAWSYGGAVSILYNAELLADALLSVSDEFPEK